jgi:hypothetical protein
MTSLLVTGGCRCGSIRYNAGKLLADNVLFICHCSMCPDKSYVGAKEYAPGMAFVAVPKFSYAQGYEHVDTVRSSPFAQRGRSKCCNMGLTMQYDCELETTWVTLDSLDDKEAIFNECNKSHIHVHALKGMREKDLPVKASDGINAYDSWQPWLQAIDPHRRASELPSVCFTCFQLKQLCNCNTPANAEVKAS